MDEGPIFVPLRLYEQFKKDVAQNKTQMATVLHSSQPFSTRQRNPRIPPLRSPTHHTDIYIYIIYMHTIPYKQEGREKERSKKINIIYAFKGHNIYHSKLHQTRKQRRLALHLLDSDSPEEVKKDFRVCRYQQVFTYRKLHFLFFLLLSHIQ